MADINQVQLPDGNQYNIKDDVSGYATETYVQNQISGITKATIGLGNVDNTSDANKPVSTAQQTALDGKTNTSMVAYVESSTTATKRYEVGDQFILNGVLYTATAIIANGGTITVGTNCTASDTIIEQIPNVEGKANKTDLTNISETGSTASQAISAGTYFYLDGTLVRAKTAIASGATFTENTNYEATTVGDAIKEVNEKASIKVLASVTADGVKTYKAIFNGLYEAVISQVDDVSVSKLVLNIGQSYYHIESANIPSGVLAFSQAMIGNDAILYSQRHLLRTGSNSSSVSFYLTTNNTHYFTDQTNTVPTSGTVFRVLSI